MDQKYTPGSEEDLKPTPQYLVLTPSNEFLSNVYQDIKEDSPCDVVPVGPNPPPFQSQQYPTNTYQPDQDTKGYPTAPEPTQSYPPGTYPDQGYPLAPYPPLPAETKIIYVEKETKDSSDWDEFCECCACFAELCECCACLFELCLLCDVDD